ncbi:MAG: hypothetical protein ACSLFQ_12650 [Thermoanaerobaculia bacterium]
MASQQDRSLVEAARSAFPLLRHVDRGGFLVGGAVRDLILGREPRDADIALRGASVEAARFAKTCGGRAVALGGAPFDVVRVAADGRVYDFAEIVGASIEEDLARRDFTIGAIAVPLDELRPVVDPFDGVGDLERSTLRMVRASNFADDPLRVLRGARFVAELALAVDAATLEAMRRQAGRVSEAAPERLGAEWFALLEANDPVALRRGLELVRELGLDRLLTGGAFGAEAIDRASKAEKADAITRLAAIAIVGDEGALCETSLRLGLGTARVDAVRRASRLFHRLVDPAASSIDPVALHDEGEEAADRAIAIVRATGRDELADRVAAFVAGDGARIFGARPLLDGHAIASITGVAPGPRIGAIRRALLVAQLRGEVRDAQEARDFVSNQGPVDEQNGTAKR